MHGRLWIVNIKEGDVSHMDQHQVHQVRYLNRPIVDDISREAITARFIRQHARVEMGFKGSMNYYI